MSGVAILEVRNGATVNVDGATRLNVSGQTQVNTEGEPALVGFNQDAVVLIQAAFVSGASAAIQPQRVFVRSTLPAIAYEAVTFLKDQYAGDPDLAQLWVNET